MSVIGSNILAGASGGAGAAAGFKIERSLRFNDDDSAYLSKQFTSAGNRRTWTWSGWVKAPLITSTYKSIFSATGAGAKYTMLSLTDNQLRLNKWGGTAHIFDVRTQAKLSDPSAWYHIICAVDTTQTTDSDKVKLYINGVRQTDLQTSTYPPDDELTHINTDDDHNIGELANSSYSGFFDGYLAETYFIDGQALDETYFGEFDDNSIWQPIDYTGTYKPQVDNSQDWSSSPYNSGNTADASYPATNAFNGSIGSTYTDGWLPAQNTTNTWTSDGNFSSATSVKIYYIATGGGALTVNGSSVTTNNDSTVRSVTVDVTGTGFSGFTNNWVGSPNGPMAVLAVEVDGVRLVDTTVSSATSNSFHLDFADNSGPTSGSNAGIGKDVSGNENYFDSNSIDPVVTDNGINIDVTSTPFTDIGSGITVTNPNTGTAVSTTTAATNSFNLTTVADVGAAGTFKVGPTTIPTTYTIDYYFRTSANQSSNAKAIYSRDSTDSYGPVDDWTNGTTSTERRVRLRDGSSSTDYSYTVTNDAWNHVRITKTNIWVNGTSITSSPIDIGGIALREFELGGTTTYQIDGEIGPFRMVAKDLGAPPAGGLVANSDGTLPNVGVSNTGTDSFIDSPTNYEADSGNNGGNYCTLNPLDKNGNVNLSNGNLEFEDGSSNYGVRSTFFLSSGKWYWEVTHTGGTGSGNFTAGIARADWDLTYVNGTNSFGYGSQGIFYPSNSGATATAANKDDVVGFALDADAGTLEVYVNGTSLGTASDANWGNIGDGPWAPAFGTGANKTCSVNFGQRSFAISSVPTGYKSLCTENLTNPTIADGSDYFDIVEYGGGADSYTISNLSFSPDLVWSKRTDAAGRPATVDTVRGAEKQLSSDRKSVELTVEDGLEQFNSDGYVVGTDAGQYGWNGGTSSAFVNWIWDGGDLATNSAYNQSQTWSSGMKTTTTATTTYSTTGRTTDFPDSLVATSPFDGDLTNYLYSQTGTQGTWWFLEFATALTNVTSIEFNTEYSCPGGVIKLNGTDVAVDQSNIGGGYVTVSVTGTIPSSLTEIAVQGYQGSARLKWVKINGKYLLDPGAIPVGSLNSSVYNQSQVWSSDTSGTQYSTSYPITNAFDGDLTTSSMSQNGGSITFTPSTAISVSSSLKIIAELSGSYTTFSVNGTDYSNLLTGTGVQTITIPETSITSIAWGRDSNGSGAVLVYGIEVDGKLLVDSNVTPANVPSIASTVRANPTAGFSIVSYTGDGGASGTIAHELNVAPEWIIVKNRDVDDHGRVYHVGTDISSPQDYYLELFAGSTGGAGTNVRANTGAVWNDTAPTSLVFSVGTEDNVNASTEDYIAYCWTSVDGYSSFGSYIGNGLNDGVFVYTGFAVRYLLTKPSSAGGDWLIWDTKRDSINPNDKTLGADNNSAQNNAGYDVDLLSNGFKFREYGGSANGSAVTYIYAAFAEHPFKFARART